MGKQRQKRQDPDKLKLGMVGFMCDLLGIECRVKYPTPISTITRTVNTNMKVSKKSLPSACVTYDGICPVANGCNSAGVTCVSDSDLAALKTGWVRRIKFTLRRLHLFPNGVPRAMVHL